MGWWIVGAIQDAQWEVDEIERRIAGVRAELARRRDEVEGLPDTTDQTTESQRVVLQGVIERLEGLLTQADHLPNSNARSLAYRLRMAQDNLHNLRRQRQALARELEAMQTKAAILTPQRYGYILDGLVDLDKVMRQYGYLESDPLLDRCISLRGWLVQQRERIDGVQVLQERLKDLGPAD